MPIESDRGESPAIRWLGLLAVVGVLIGVSACFLPVQTLWSDETTQLCGLGLDPLAMVRWLAGTESHDFAQFRDRMPPASYWLGWAWVRAFGPGEASLRWSGVACVAMASALVYEAARRAFGAAAGWAAGLSFATSPRVVVIAVEIRAYPLFLFGSAASFYILTRLAGRDPARGDGEGPPRRGFWLASLAGVLAATMATHFYGVVLAGAILTALSAIAWRRGWRAWPIVGVFGAVGLAVLAILPFVRNSLGKPGFGTTHGPIHSLEAVYKLVLNLFDHPTLMVDGPVEAGVLAGAVILAVAASRSRTATAGAVALGLAAGLAAVGVAEMALARENFFPTAPHYNLWMKPGLCLLLSAGLGTRSRAIRRAAVLASGLLIAAQSAGLAQLSAHGSHFAHGPHRAMADLIRTLGPERVAVVHDDPSGHFALVSCPIRYEFGPTLEQFQLLDSSRVTATDGPLRTDLIPRPVSALPHRYLLVVRPSLVGDRDLARQVRSGDRPIEPGPIYRALLGSEGRSLARHEQHVAYISARVDVFERVGR